MDDYDDLDEQGSEGAPPTPVAGTDANAAEVERLKKENYKLRDKVRRTDLSAKFGSDVVELIPASLPAQEWEAYAEKLQALKGAAPVTAEPPGEAVKVPEPPSEETKAAEAAMAAVASTPSSRGGTAPPQLSAQEIGQLMQSDPAAGLAAANAKYGQRA